MSLVETKQINTNKHKHTQTNKSSRIMPLAETKQTNTNKQTNKQTRAGSCD
jgi:hypothetical protein